MAERAAFVYLLRCADGSLYCGWTYDVDDRLAVHRSGKGARYTRQRLPVELAAVIELPDESCARKEELRIKSLTRPQKLALVAANAVAPEPVVGRQRAARAGR
jgi:putative endonuclease